MRNLKVKKFYEGSYGDDTHFVGMEEESGTKTVLLRGLCRSVAGETANLLNATWLQGKPMKDAQGYACACIEQMQVIDADRDE